MPADNAGIGYFCLFFSVILIILPVMIKKSLVDKIDFKGAGGPAATLEDIKRRLLAGDEADSQDDEPYETPFAPEAGDELFVRATLPDLQKRRAAIDSQDKRKTRRPSLAPRIFKDRKFIEYFERMGYKDPISRLMGIANADVVELAKILQCPRERAFGYISKACETLAPYWLAKAPTDVNVQSRSLGFFYNAGNVPRQDNGAPADEALDGQEFKRVLSVRAIDNKIEKKQ